MKKDYAKLIYKIKEYDLFKNFKNIEKLSEWLHELSDEEASRFLSLSIPASDIVFPKKLLIHKNLLQCEDYLKRVEAMNQLKNGDGVWHLFERLCSLNFLHSKNYYSDMNLLKSSKNLQYALWVINDDNFIQSPYHQKDLKMILGAKDVGGNDLDFLVASALAMISKNKDSLQSPYHEEDMKFITKIGSSSLQGTYSYPEHSVDYLALNKNSLKDKYHLENMKILAENYSISYYLYPLMTKKEYIQGKYYREEIQALTKANSKLKARAIYYYITNSSLSAEERMDLDNELWDNQVPFRAVWFGRKKMDNSEKGSKNPKYLENLALLNSLEDKYVLFIERLLSDSLLRKQNYQEKDIQTLLSLNNDELFFDLFEVMSNKNSIASIYHLMDISLIQNTSSYFTRRMLISMATNQENLNSKNHWFDMNYVASLDFDLLDSKMKDLLQYLFLTSEGIKDKKRMFKLKQIQPEFSMEKIDKKGLKLPKGKVLMRIKRYFV